MISLESPAGGGPVSGTLEDKECKRRCWLEAEKMPSLEESNCMYKGASLPNPAGLGKMTRRQQGGFGGKD